MHHQLLELLSQRYAHQSEYHTYRSKIQYQQDLAQAVCFAHSALIEQLCCKRRGLRLLRMNIQVAQ